MGTAWKQAVLNDQGNPIRALYNTDMGFVHGVVSLLMAVLFFLSAAMCFQMTAHAPVTMPAVWILGLILSLLYLIWVISRWNLCERYTMKRFEACWIQDRSRQKGLYYHDRPGCYVILSYRLPHILPFTFTFSDVYVGQSMEVYRRVHSHLNRKGNGDVYADVRDGKHIEIEIYPCKPSRLNDLEKTLIRKYHAEEYYNRTVGGAKKRGFLKK
ncbi:MAG: GIY-YIG nuclease family protein [Solobacterium sp.]|nr:GIY-YIG nuclease family protein [Solobacterium sp.]